MRWTIALALLLLLSGTALAQTDATDAADGDIARGEEIYQATCAMCHGTDATGMMGMHPALTGVLDRLTAEGVEVTIRNGRDTNPPMPAFDNRLDDSDIADLIAYLTTLPDGPRNFANDGDGGMMGGGRMGGMMGGGSTALWIAIVILAAALSGVVAYRLGRVRRDG